jgi:hypothetical protein
VRLVSEYLIVPLPHKTIKMAENTKADEGVKVDETVKTDDAIRTDDEAGQGTAKSLVCNECGKSFRNQDAAEFHAVKS